jgi:hypothetical protein
VDLFPPTYVEFHHGEAKRNSIVNNSYRVSGSKMVEFQSLSIKHTFCIQTFFFTSLMSILFEVKQSLAR